MKGWGACNSDAVIHGIVLSQTRGESSAITSQQSLHPTVQGAQIYANVASSALAAA